LILVTIGSLFPFDRLVTLADAIAASMPERSFFCQIGEGRYEPVNMPFARMMPARDFQQKIAEAELIVAHAGMGSVISAMEASKPIVILPRRMELGEHTTDHQMATARWLMGRPGVQVVMEDADLAPTISAALSGSAGAAPIPTAAPQDFINKIRDFIEHA
jgi:UDP-N-acetylglucosamine transferase subunit ALG13